MNDTLPPPVDSAAPAPGTTAPGPPAAPRAVPVVLLVTAATAAVGGVGLVRLPAELAGGPGERIAGVLFLAAMLVFAAVGALVLRRRPEHAGIGWLLLAVGVLGAGGRAVIGLALETAPATPAPLAWATNWAWVPGATAVLVLLLRFPTGALPTPPWRWVELAVLAWGLVAVGVTALVPGPLGVSPLDRANPYALPHGGWLTGLLPPLFTVLPLLMVLAAAALLARYRHAAAVERQQLRWIAAAVAPLALAAPLALLGGAGPVLEGLAYLLLTGAVVVAVLHHRLWDLGLVVRRGAAYALASAMLLTAYLGTVAVAQQLLAGRAPDAVATAVVAVGAAPVLTVAQRAVERLLYGDRRDPDRVVDELARRLAGTPESLLPEVVTQVARSLRLPFVAVELTDGSVAASWGAPMAEVLRIPLQHNGRPVGWLVAGRRTPGEALGARDVRLLQRVADHAALAVRSTLLAAELRQSADRLRVARAEERQRLRRDLHDGLGPALGAVSMRAEGARNLLACGELARVDEVLAAIERGAESAVAEVRRILADLQPRVLEEEGLTAALRSVVADLPPALDVRLEAALPAPLAPRVELAAYRVTAEALRNVVRHARARSVAVTVRIVDGQLEAVVADDGAGFRSDAREGVGLASMRSRAAELGGDCRIAAGEDGGTVVRLRVPVVQT